MKKLFTLLAAFTLAVSTSFAQRNLYYWEKNGHVSIEPASQVDSLTFEVGGLLFKISTSAPTSVTTDRLQATAHVAFADNVKSLSKDPEIGVCFSSENDVPIYGTDECKRLGTSVKDYDFTLYELEPGTTYYYRTYVKLEDEVFYGNVKSITTFGEKPTTPTHLVINGHKFVNLGLPSGLLWAKTNIGALSSTDDGDYFAWGEVETKSSYSWNTYKWGGYNHYYDSLSKYNSKDGKSTLDAEDDVATIQWGNGCRMPTRAEFYELYKKCDWYWKSDYNETGVSGYLVSGPNGNTIFLPASGSRANDGLYNRGSFGFYWSSLLRSSYTYNAFILYFDSDGVSPIEMDNYRCYGRPVRPVAEK